MKEKAPYMPWYGREFYGDENVMVMTLEQEGAYLRLLWNCWQEGSIPSDIARLAAMCKNIPTRKFARDIWPALQDRFVASGGRLVHQKVETIREGKEEFRKKCSDAGKIGNNRRWGRDRVPDADPMQTRPEPESGINRKSVASDFRLPISEEKGDLDYTTTNHKNRDSSPCQSPECKQYPDLKEELHRYFQEPGQEDLYPSDRLVVDVMDAAGGATEQEVIACLRYLHGERGLLPGTRNGPNHWSWFPVAVADYFKRKRARELPPAAASTQDREEFEQMTEFMELPEGGE